MCNILSQITNTTLTNNSMVNATTNTYNIVATQFIYG